MKTILFFAIIFITASLFAQYYTLTHATFNAGGGAQSNTIYSSTANIGEYVVGEITMEDGDFIGYLGFLFPILDQRPPFINSIDDVPNDQGRKVQIVWEKCAFDDVYNDDTFYSVWREDIDFNPITSENISTNPNEKNSFKTAKVLNEQISTSSKKNIYSNPQKVVEEYRKNPNEKYYWQRDNLVWTFIAEVPALQHDIYAVIAPTLADSSNTGINDATFKVVYHDHNNYYESPANAGYSVDNIAPDAALISMTTNNNTSMNLIWNKVEYGTFAGNKYPELNGIWYKIYASDSPYFNCDSSTYLTTTTNLNYQITPSDNQKFFKVIVSDKP